MQAFMVFLSFTEENFITQNIFSVDHKFLKIHNFLSSFTLVTIIYNSQFEFLRAIK